MKKIVFGAILFLILSFGFSVYYILSNLDGIVKAAIESYGSEATGTKVAVGSVQLGLKDGSGAIRGLTVGNPAGFTAGQVFSLGEIATQVELKSLSEEVTVIEYIRVQAPQVFFELNQAGKNNLEVLKQKLTAKGSDDSSSAATGKSSEPRLIIRKLIFSAGNIQASVLPLNKSYELPLPTIEMNNLGGVKGATPTQIADQVLDVLTRRALDEVKRKGLAEYRGKVEGEVNKLLNNGKVGEALKGLFH